MTAPHPTPRKGNAPPQVQDAPAKVACPYCKRQHEPSPTLGRFCSVPCLTCALTEKFQNPEGEPAPHHATRSKHHAS